MKFIFLLLLSTVPALCALDEEKFLNAIVQAEVGRHVKSGPVGERGPYQFTLTCWKQHTKASFNLADNQGVAHVVALRHLRWLEASIKHKGGHVDPKTLAMCWNEGLSRTLDGEPLSEAIDYGSRVSALYSSR